jgi:hypothetical protein
MKKRITRGTEGTWTGISLSKLQGARLRARGVLSEEFPTKVAWDCCLQNDWKGNARMICMGRGEW